MWKETYVKNQWKSNIWYQTLDSDLICFDKQSLSDII
jgi:hypothetical protein